MQLKLDFEPGLTERHKTLLCCIRECAYKSSKPLKAIAADMDLSESDLSRKLSGHDSDTRRLTVDDLVKIIDVMGDVTPVNWLIERFHIDDETKARRAASEFLKQLPQIIATAKAMGAKL